MASTIKHKRSTTAGAVPATGALVEGELAVNVADGKVFVKRSNGSVTNVTADGHTHSLSSLSDVIFTGSATNGQVLKYDGTKWVNGTDSTGGGGSVTAEDDQIILAMRVFA